jgi:phage replication O-like protein O
MAAYEEDRFVRVPTEFLEALLRARLSGTQWRIILWVVRQTYGWNREMTPFSWYGLAQDLALDRGGVVRAGRKLFQSGILRAEGGETAIVKDFAQWGGSRLAPQGGEEGSSMTDVSDDGSHRKAMTENIASDDTRHRNRCQASSLFRRAKDSCKDRLKTYKDRRAHESTPHRTERGNTQRPLLAGAARPIPGKYDGLSQD